MSALLIWYPKCSTCQKANKWLEEHGIDCEKRHIVEENPTAAELQEWVERSGKPSKSFFNTSGNLYKELGLKGKLPDMDDRQRFELLATNGMLVKRPIFLMGDVVLVGFKPAEWEAALLK
ncbi:MAG: arsenate reductase family protein [Clostridiales bacterium]|nr:arsenate reductase family protein [Clostridiales bacterium]